MSSSCLNAVEIFEESSFSGSNGSVVIAIKLSAIPQNEAENMLTSIVWTSSTVQNRLAPETRTSADGEVEICLDLFSKVGDVRGAVVSVNVRHNEIEEHAKKLQSPGQLGRGEMFKKRTRVLALSRQKSFKAQANLAVDK
jgi:hypothetical protein